MGRIEIQVVGWHAGMSWTIALACMAFVRASLGSAGWTVASRLACLGSFPHPCHLFHHLGMPQA
jgi:hypothetical protein